MTKGAYRRLAAGRCRLLFFVQKSSSSTLLHRNENSVFIVSISFHWFRLCLLRFTRNFHISK